MAVAVYALGMAAAQVPLLPFSLAPSLIYYSTVGPIACGLLSLGSPPDDIGVEVRFGVVKVSPCLDDGTAPVSPPGALIPSLRTPAFGTVVMGPGNTFGPPALTAVVGTELTVSSELVKVGEVACSDLDSALALAFSALSKFVVAVAAALVSSASFLV